MHRLIALVVVLVVGGLSCAQNQSAAPRSTPAAVAPAPAAAPNKTAVESSIPNIPRDARWTIYCWTFHGPAHMAEAKNTRAHLQRTTSLRDWYIIHGDSQTILYYGFYKAVEDHIDKKEAARAQADRKAIRALMDPATGRQFFPSAIHVTLDTADPLAPPEWNIANARPDTRYTLQIGVCKDDPERKLKAVEAVRAARAEGFEAYFFHGPTSSSVCIGAWPESAVRVQMPGRAVNPDAVVITADSSVNLPARSVTPDGQPIEVKQIQFEVLDPTLQTVMRQFPRTTFNGFDEWELTDQRTGQKRRVVIPSRLVEIPRSPGGARMAATPVSPSQSPALTPAPGPTVTPVPPAPVTNPKPRPLPGGRLRSLED